MTILKIHDFMNSEFNELCLEKAIYVSNFTIHRKVTLYLCACYKFDEAV